MGPSHRRLVNAPHVGPLRRGDGSGGGANQEVQRVQGPRKLTCRSRPDERPLRCLLDAILALTLLSNIEFSKLISFNGFVFGGEVKFENSEFSQGIPMFQKTIFAGNSSFDDAAFNNDVIFFEAEFAGSASFERTDFLGRVYFSYSKFSRNTHFTNARFESSAYFNSTEFLGETYFRNASFANESDFQKAKFTKPTHFEGVHFKQVVPAFFEASLYEYTDWHSSKWPEVPKDGADARKQGQYYQRLSLLMNQLQKPGDQHFFFRKEMRAQRRIERWNIVNTMNWL